MSLSGKVVVITGGTGALGTVVARRLQKEGATVFSTSTDNQSSSPATKVTQGTINVLKADVTDEASVMRLFDEVIRTGQKVDVVVNTVGGFVPGKPVADTPVADWDLMMTLNLKSTFLCTREALRRMKGKPYGRVINIGAMTGLNPQPGRAAYSISKAGVALLTELAAREVKGTGITVNAIAPSIIDTAVNRNSMPGEDYTKWVKPEEIAETICFLCSVEAGSVTGTTIRASGGL